MIKSYDVTVYEYYYESTYEVDNLRFSTEEEAKEFEKKIALSYMTKVMRFFRRRVPSTFVLQDIMSDSLYKENNVDVYRTEIISGVGDGVLRPITGGNHAEVKLLHGNIEGLQEISWHYNIRKGILRVAGGEVKIFEYNEETGQYYKIDDSGNVEFYSDKVDTYDDLTFMPEKFIRNGHDYGYNVVWVEDEGAFYIKKTNEGWIEADSTDMETFEKIFELSQQESQILDVVNADPHANDPWWKKLLRKIWEGLKALGQKIVNFFTTLIDLIKGTAYIGYIIDFSWVDNAGNINYNFKELYETAEALQLSICTKFWTPSQAVKHFNNIIDVMNNTRGYDFPTNDNKIINNWDGTQQNRMEQYYDGGYYVYDKVRGWITAVEAIEDGIL